MAVQRPLLVVACLLVLAVAASAQRRPGKHSNADSALSCACCCCVVLTRGLPSAVLGSSCCHSHLLQAAPPRAPRLRLRYAIRARVRKQWSGLSQCVRSRLFRRSSCEQGLLPHSTGTRAVAAAGPPASWWWRQRRWRQAGAGACRRGVLVHAPVQSCVRCGRHHIPK